MKYIEEYTEYDIDYNCGVLYGIFHPLGDITIKRERGTYYIANNTKDNTFMFGEIDEYKLYKDVVGYGNKLYSIFSNEIGVKLYDSTTRDPYESISIPITYFSSDDKLKAAFNICKDFVKDYNLPFDTQYYAFPRRAIGYFQNSMLRIVNYLLISFMVHTVFVELSDGYEKYPNIYKALDISNNLNNNDVLKIITKIHNSFRYLERENIGAYKVTMIENGNIIIPIRYANNLFTFVHEVITYNICTLSFHSLDTSNSINKYVVFRKCSVCLKNLSDDVDTQLEYKRIPIFKKKYCAECKIKAKRHSSTVYEHSIRRKYDEIKSNRSHISNVKLISKIDSMPPKDKITKAYLNELEAEIAKEKGRD